MWHGILKQYILCYSKDKTLLDNWIDYRAIKGKLDNPDNDKRGNWFSGYLANVCDKEDLYLKMKKFIELPYDEKVEMGKVRIIMSLVQR